MLNLPVRIREPFKPWNLCIRYRSTLSGKEEYSFKTGIQSNAWRCICKYFKRDDRWTDHSVLILRYLTYEN